MMVWYPWIMQICGQAVVWMHMTALDVLILDEDDCAKYILHVVGFVQERRNSSTLAMELRLSCTYPSM